MSDQPDDLEKTSKMDEPPAKTGAEAPTSAAESTEKKVPPTASAPPKAPATATAPPSAPVTAQSPASGTMPAVSEGTPASGGGVGSFLSNFGINDPNTQKVVLFGGGGVILLCCLCTCVGVGVSMMGSLGSLGQ